MREPKPWALELLRWAEGKNRVILVCMVLALPPTMVWGSWGRAAHGGKEQVERADLICLCLRAGHLLVPELQEGSLDLARG